MSLDGFAYVPPACEAGGCKVHVAFHGCRQTAETVGDAFDFGVAARRLRAVSGLVG